MKNPYLNIFEKIYREIAFFFVSATALFEVPWVYFLQIFSGERLFTFSVFQKNLSIPYMIRAPLTRNLHFKNSAEFLHNFSEGEIQVFKQSLHTFKTIFTKIEHVFQQFPCRKWTTRNNEISAYYSAHLQNFSTILTQLQHFAKRKKKFISFRRSYYCLLKL